MSVYETDTIVVRVGAETKTQLVERAREHERSLSGEVRHGLRRYLEDLERARREGGRVTNDPMIFGYDVTSRRIDSDRPANWIGDVSDGLDASDERVAFARERWVEGRAEDFVHVRRRIWRDRASGREYRHTFGNPLLALGSPTESPVSTFLIVGGKLTFLEPADAGQPEVRELGTVTSRKASGRERAA